MDGLRAEQPKVLICSKITQADSKAKSLRANKKGGFCILAQGDELLADSPAVPCRESRTAEQHWTALGHQEHSPVRYGKSILRVLFSLLQAPAPLQSTKLFFCCC